jgi:hypothetical protein
VTTFPDPAVLYPDVAAAGSLAAALQAAAEERGLMLGEVTANRKDPLRYAKVSSSTPLRDALVVSAGAAERYWSIAGWGQGIELASGSTRELPEITVRRRAGGTGRRCATFSGRRRSST